MNGLERSRRRENHIIVESSREKIHSNALISDDWNNRHTRGCLRKYQSKRCVDERKMCLKKKNENSGGGSMGNSCYGGLCLAMEGNVLLWRVVC